MTNKRAGKQKAFKEKQKNKNRIKMSNNKQIVRKATWAPDERFPLNGEEFQALSQFASLVAPLVEMSNRMMGQAELDDKLGFEYIYSDNTPVEDALVKQYEEERLQKLAKKREEIEKYMALLQSQNEKLVAEMNKIKPTVEETTAPGPETAVHSPS
jgi:hypothetical protein